MTTEQPEPNAPYPFDPSDWTTITSLFKALEEMSIPPGGFMVWLQDWNQLDIAIWDAYTFLKRRAYTDTSDTEAERVYQAYVEQLYSTYLGLTQTLYRRALALQPTAPSPDYERLWRVWHNQTTLFHPDSLAIQAEISRLEGRYREIMRRYENTSNDPFAYWMERRDELNDLMLQLLKQRRALARTSGLPNFLAYRWRELNRLDYSIEDCQAFHRIVETSVVPLIAELRSKNQTLPPFPDVPDSEALSVGIERILRQVDSTFGEIFHAMRDGYLDIGSRANKAPAIEAWFFPRTGMPYLHVSSNHIGSTLHESGHAIHFYLSFQQQPSIWNYGAPEEFQEFAATNMEMLAWPYFAQANGGLFNEAESTSARQHTLRYYTDTLTDCVMQDAFEHWVYGEAPENVTSADLDAKWLELRQRFVPWDNSYSNREEAMTCWQRWTWSLFRLPLYMMTYSMAVVGVCQFARQAHQDRAQAIRGFKEALALGNTWPLPELFRACGVEFPFTEEAVQAAAQFILQSWESNQR